MSPVGSSQRYQLRVEVQSVTERYRLLRTFVRVVPASVFREVSDVSGIPWFYALPVPGFMRRQTECVLGSSQQADYLVSE